MAGDRGESLGRSVGGDAQVKSGMTGAGVYWRLYGTTFYIRTAEEKAECNESVQGCGTITGGRELCFAILPHDV